MKAHAPALAALLALVMLSFPIGGGTVVVRAQGAMQPFVGRAWVSTDAGSAPGTLRAFLPDGTLVMDSCGEGYRLTRWTLVRHGRVAWEEDGQRIEADLVRATADALQLRLHLVGGTRDERYRPARVPYVCPDRRTLTPRSTTDSPAASASIVVEGTVAYLERIMLPPGATLTIELRDVSRADAPARVLASQKRLATDGPPFAFSLRAPRAAIDARSRLSLYADIRDGDRRLFVTDQAQPVPATGATGLQVRMRFAGTRG